MNKSKRQTVDRAAYPFTSEAEIRQRVTEVCNRNKGLITNASANKAGLTKELTLTLDTEATARAATIENWIQRLIHDTKQRNMLMTSQQLRDWKSNRTFVVGDTVRFIGPSRIESIGDNAEVERTTGQTGTIIRVEQATGHLVELQLFAFRPDKPVKIEGSEDTLCVDLEVVELTPAWLELERIED